MAATYADTSSGYGLISGMANGFREGLIGFQTMQNAKHQQQMQELLSGVTKDDQGNLQFTPEMQEQRQAQQGLLAKKSAAESSEYDANSPAAIAQQKFLQAQAPNAGLKAEDIPEGLSLHDYEKYHKDIDTGLSSQAMIHRGDYAADQRLQAAQTAADAKLNAAKEVTARGLLPKTTTTTTTYTDDEGNQHTQQVPVEKPLSSRDRRGIENQYNNDATIKMYSQRLDGADKIQDLIESGKKGDFKNTGAVLAQLNAEISRLETGSQSPALGAAEKTDMLSSAADLHKIYDKITNSVSDVDLKAQYDQASAMINDLGHSYAKAIDRRKNVLAAGAQPGAGQVFESKNQAFHKNYPRFYDQDEAQAQSAPRGLIGQSGGGSQMAQAAPQASQQDIAAAQQALQWASAHPDDQRAAGIAAHAKSVIGGR